MHVRDSSPLVSEDFFFQAPKKGKRLMVWMVSFTRGEMMTRILLIKRPGLIDKVLT